MILLHFVDSLELVGRTMCPSGYISLRSKADNRELEQKTNKNPNQQQPKSMGEEKECFVDRVCLSCREGNQKLCTPSSLIWRSPAQRGILAVSLRGDIFLHGRETSGCWGKICVLFLEAAECLSSPRARW